MNFGSYKDGHTEKITAGATEEALAYEVSDMEAAVDGDNRMCLDYTIDVMKLMTEARKEWGLRYPEEEREVPDGKGEVNSRNILKKLSFTVY